jgi:hypothetical protein
MEKIKTITEYSMVTKQTGGHSEADQLDQLDQ